MNLETIFTAGLIADIAAVVFLLIFVIAKAKKGLYRSLAPMAVVLVAIFCAIFLSGAVTEPIAEWLAPQLEEKISSKLDLGVLDQVDLKSVPLESILPKSIYNLLKTLKLDQTIQEWEAEKSEEPAQETEPLSKRVAAGLVNKGVRIASFLVVFLLAFLVLTLIRKILEAATELPGIRFINGLAGGVLGLIEGAVFLFILLWILKLISVPGLDGIVSQSHFLKYFY